MPMPVRRFLRVNLSDRFSMVCTVPEEMVKLMIGGRGFGISYLYKEQLPNMDPLEKENKLLFLTGPLAGTAAQSASRWMVCTRSPLTGVLARSVAGADFGAWLRFAGYEFIVIEGKADKGVYIHLTPDTCNILDAPELWGLNTTETQNWLQARHGKDTRVACIGQAGEKLVKYAAIVSGRRTASRCGVGTVMGSKNLKAIAITTRRSLHLHDPETFLQLAREQSRLYRSSQSFKHHRKMGTTNIQDLTQALGIFPVRNFRFGQQDDGQKLFAEEYLKLRTGEFGCYNCSARCGKAHKVTDGTYAEAASEGPEYESIWSFSGSIDSTSLEATIAADQLCDDLGLDTISTGNTIGFAYELYEKGIITRKDADGLELVYGNHEAMISLIKKIALREGFGGILAEGAMRAASIIGRGAEDYAMHVKGLELPGYEPRGAKSQGFSYATSNIGGSHCYGYASQEIFGVPIPRAVDRFAEAENADIVIHNQHMAAAGEVGIICGFSRAWGWFPQIFGKMLAATTGVPECEDPSYLVRVGERIVNLERAFNVREGFRREHDMLPKRMMTEALHTKGGPGEGQIIREMEEFLDRYYELRGWSREGVPTREKVKELNLSSLLQE